MEMYLKALAARRLEAEKHGKDAPGRTKEVPAIVGDVKEKPVPAPIQKPLPVDNKSRAAGDDWDAEDLAELMSDDEGMTEVVE